MSGKKVSIRFFEDREVRAIWDEERSDWFFSAVDIVAVLNNESDYKKARNYWKYLKGKLKKEKNQLVSATNQLKLSAPDGKKRLADTFDGKGVIELAKNFPNAKAAKFLDWFLYSENTIDGQSKKRLIRFLRAAVLLKTKMSAQQKACGKFMPIFSADCTILRGRLGQRTFQKAVSALPRRDTWTIL